MAPVSCNFGGCVAAAYFGPLRLRGFRFWPTHKNVVPLFTRMWSQSIIIWLSHHQHWFHAFSHVLWPIKPALLWRGCGSPRPWVHGVAWRPTAFIAWIVAFILTLVACSAVLPFQVVSQPFVRLLLHIFFVFPNFLQSHTIPIVYPCKGLDMSNK